MDDDIAWLEQLLRPPTIVQRPPPVLQMFNRRMQLRNYMRNPLVEHQVHERRSRLNDQLAQLLGEMLVQAIHESDDPFENRGIRDEAVLQDTGAVVDCGAVSMEHPCSICNASLDDAPGLFEDDQVSRVVRRLNCGHMFHEPCIHAWLRVNAVCPLCRADVRGEE